jgi:hypothetical protein
MARGRPRKHATKIRKPVVEILPPEPEPDEPPQKVVEVKHKTEWSEMRPIEEAPEDEPPFFEEEVEEDKPRRRPSEREELKRKLAKGNITPGSQLKITIERYIHSEMTDGDGGSYAEREHCTKYICAEEHILSEDYLDTARKFGPGLYRFTVRMRNQVVTAWDKRISASAVPPANGAAPAADVAQIFGTSDPAQLVGQLSWQEIMKMQDSLVERRMKELKMFRDAFGDGQQTPAQTIATDPKLAALQMIAENPDVMAQIGKGIASTVLGKGATGDSDPWADVAMECVKSGQAVGIVREAISAFFNGVSTLFPKANNGAPPPFGPPGPQPGPTRPMPPPQVVPVAQQGEQQVTPANQPPQLNEADALVISLIKAMERKAPASEAVNLINVACYRTPELGESVDALINMSPDGLLAMLTAYHADVAKWDHAKKWLADLTEALTAGEEEAGSE